jgi:hypothetical protein
MCLPQLLLIAGRQVTSLHSYTPLIHTLIIDRTTAHRIYHSFVRLAEASDYLVRVVIYLFNYSSFFDALMH